MMKVTKKNKKKNNKNACRDISAAADSSVLNVKKKSKTEDTII